MIPHHEHHFSEERKKSVKRKRDDLAPTQLQTQLQPQTQLQHQPFQQFPQQNPTNDPGFSFPTTISNNLSLNPASHGHQLHPFIPQASFAQHNPYPTTFSTSGFYGDTAQPFSPAASWSDLSVTSSVRRKWEPYEDERLRSAVSVHGERNWKSIAEMVPGRNHVQCLQRWKKVLKPGLVKGHWSQQEDDLLRAVVARGFKNWGEVASQIQGRTAKQCRERWSCNLDPAINKEKWTQEEDEKILRLVSELGHRWSQFTQDLPGRTENAIKTRAKSLQKKLKKVWTPEEDIVIRSLKTLRLQSGELSFTRSNSWSKIASRLEGRTVNAVKKRWKILRERLLETEDIKDEHRESDIAIPQISSGNNS